MPLGQKRSLFIQCSSRAFLLKLCLACLQQVPWSRTCGRSCPAARRRWQPRCCGEFLDQPPPVLIWSIASFLHTALAAVAKSRNAEGMLVLSTHLSYELVPAEVETATGKSPSPNPNCISGFLPCRLQKENEDLRGSLAAAEARETDLITWLSRELPAVLPPTARPAAAAVMTTRLAAVHGPSKPGSGCTGANTAGGNAAASSAGDPSNSLLHVLMAATADSVAGASPVAQRLVTEQNLFAPSPNRCQHQRFAPAAAAETAPGSTAGSAALGEAIFWTAGSKWMVPTQHAQHVHCVPSLLYGHSNVPTYSRCSHTRRVFFVKDWRSCQQQPGRLLLPAQSWLMYGCSR